MLTKKLAWKTTTILSIIGIFLAVYLFYSYLKPPAAEFCNINDWWNCNAITTGELSTFLGIPVAAVGLIGYIVILVSSLARKKKLLLGMTTFGVLFCLRITYLEVFAVKILCPVCLACQLIMILVFLLSLYLNFAKSPKKAAS